MRRRVCFAFLLAACSTPPSSTPDAGGDAFVEPPPSVMLEEGEVRGIRGNGFINYLGIPYAEAPTGDLRFAPPVAHAPWSTPIGPVRMPPSCPQTALGIAAGSEDCLVVNVHVPVDAPANAPVMVWIHGGAFLVGSGVGLDRSTMGDFFARNEQAIVVSLNYRLGPFGFFRYPGVAEGNQGFLDQQLALRWVRDHIAAFGGDPSRVTIVGESAGGLSICLHLIAPESRGLFARAISESGLCDARLPSAAEAEASGAMIAEAAGCTGGDVAACMRAASIQALFTAAGDAADLSVLLSGTSNRPFWPAIDGTVIPGSFRDVVSAGEHSDVPTILGWNRDEGTLFVGLAEMSGTAADEAAYERSVNDFGTREGIDLGTLRAAYPLADYPDPGAAIADMVGDAELICPSRRAALLLADAGTEVHVYRFDHDGAHFQLALPRALGAFHSAELQFVFGHPVGMASFEGAQATLATAIQGAWGAFVRAEDPGAALGIAWPSFAVGAEPSVVLDDVIVAGAALNRTECALWD